MSERYVAYVGTYTLGKSKGIHIYDVDLEKPALTLREVIPVKNSSHICKSANGKFLYSIADEGVAVFSIKKDGGLEKINQIEISGMRGTHLSVSPDGKYLFIAGYHDGKVTLIHTHHDGRLGSEVDGVFHKGLGSVVERNFRPHVSCVTPTPDGKYCCAVDNGIDQVKVYSVTQNGKLALADILRCKLESAPRNMKFSKDGRFVYLLCELQNVVRVLKYHPEHESDLFEEIQTISTTREGADVKHDASSGFGFSPDGEFLFVSVAGENSVSMFKVDQETGKLEKRFTLPISGVFPKDVKVFPDGKHIAVVNHMSGTITMFTVNYDQNTIVMKGKPVQIDTPNCITFTRVED
jgi:6-phosphogluconolactonase